MTMLHDLATAAGLQIDWTDASGQAKRVADDALADVLAALGYPDDGTSLNRLRADQAAAARSFVSGEQGQAIALPDGGRGTLHLAGGGAVDVDGIVPPLDEFGYHRLDLGTHVMTVAVAPPRCFTVADAAPGRRSWGPAVQIPALRDTRATAFGDFTTLARSATALGAAGADLIGISPVHALFPADPGRYSPYAPSSRLFLNILYADPALVGHPITGEAAPDLIDWGAAIPQRIAALRAAFDARPDAVSDAVARFAEQGGAALQRHARFDALHARFFSQGAHGWQDWPTAYRDPAGDAVARFAREHADEVDFYLFCQWLADRGLAEAQSAAKDAGMALGLVADLAVGMDAGGSHAWSRPQDLITGLSVGAPPDLLGPAGQNWGITGFSPLGLARSAFEPFIATIRAALAHAGGIRIDHAMGLQRLWVVPDGKSAADGAYLSYPVDDMLRILAIESQTAGAIVIGEDLGTVPEGFRPKLDQRHVLGMRVMPFEADGDRLKPPAAYDAAAAVMTGTHDLPTIAGWWRGRDIEVKEEAGVFAESIDDRARQRTGWWRSFVEAGVATGDQPPPDDPAPVVAAALAFVGRTPCDVAVIPLEDIAGLVEQPNLPGTTIEHPNWRRRMPADTAVMLDDAVTAANVATLKEARSR
ncbi:4-alpha-glucanotransferase [Sphingomonas rubra]|uniref:4-alpha-glucanotransferase n=1 Tax=Sphingomonas rubra TaxID=634430 RepID=A0A1I5R9E4_9SPHN|nr:4-alpha-glucanotransferase [Sphingomonas rubra]SFP55030.1 4-alpha-glucanotransferase [Sphingomonas rubra]